jgi:uncharacterized membrane protein (DUF485 family)
MMWEKIAELIAELKENKEGIVTIVGLIMFFVLLIMFAAFSPVLMETISMAKGCVTDTISTMILDLIPAMILLGIVVSYLIYAGAGR